MRIPFLQHAGDEPPLRIPVPESVEAIYLVFVRAPLGPPPVEPLPAVAAAWVEQHASEPLRSAVREALRADVVQFTAMPAGELPPLPRELLRAGEWGERK